MNLRQEAIEYSTAVVAYEVANKLPSGMLSRPDHLSLKAFDINHFEHLVRTISGVAIDSYCFEDQGRFVVASRLQGRLPIGMFGHVQWVEVKEPRKEDELAGIDHAEFLTTDFGWVLEVLSRKGLEPRVQTEGDHHRINLQLLEDGKELRITDTPIAAIVNEKIESDRVYHLDAA